MMSSNYVYHTERRLIHGLFLHKRKQLTKDENTTNNNKNKLTNNQMKRWGSEETTNNSFKFKTNSRKTPFA